MLPKKSLELVHLQITRNCNLRCWFCGQWGKKGFFSDKSGGELSLNEWKLAIDDIKKYCEKSGELPSVILWGGEPLVSPYFDEISKYLYENGFRLGMVTNGVLIDRHVEQLKKYFTRIYVSVDGPKHIHDSIRGEGVFDKVENNLKLIRGADIEIVIMSVLSDALIDELDSLPKAFEPLYPDEVILQEMISLSESEVQSYKNWMQSCFSINAVDINSWASDKERDNEEKKQAAIKKLLEKKTDFKIVYRPHGDKAAREFCLSPFRHVHIAWNGNVIYCTDFYDFCAGNVKNEPLSQIFENDISEKYRNEIFKGNCATCNHCSWRNNESFRF